MNAVCMFAWDLRVRVRSCVFVCLHIRMRVHFYISFAFVS